MWKLKKLVTFNHAIRTYNHPTTTLRHTWRLDRNQITTYKQRKLNMKRYTKQQIILAFNHERILAIRTKLAFTRLKRELREKQRLINAAKEKLA